MPTRPTQNPQNLRDRLLDHFGVLRIPITPGQFDAVTRKAEREHLSHLEFLEALIAEQANQRRERSIQHRIREAHFREPRDLEAFDWKFNAATIDRVQIEELATGDFVRRNDNLVMVGQSGVGKSHIVQSLGRRACALGYRVRYTTSAALLKDLTA
ncbi:MAG: ATP-binding protein, partial [Planctomycetota bacterium]